MLARRLLVGPAALAAALCLGCQATSPPDVPLRTTADLSGLLPDPERETPDRRVWLRPGAKTLSEFSAFAIQPAEIRLETTDPELLTSSDEALLQLELRRAVERELGSAGYALAGKPGPGVLDLR
ncbi:MAG TPA: DUF3313 family protein, partial [Planctomycetota bacterium]|nr:DUF3313 family protein [Planctomycetota bacterium]